MSTNKHRNNPQAVEALLDTAVSHHQAGRLKDAERTYLDVLKIDWVNGDALRFLGGLYVQLGQPAQAETTLRQALQVLPAHAEIHHNLGIALRNQGKLEEAVHQFEASLAVKANYSEAYNNLGFTYYLQKRFFSALAIYEKVLSFAPDHRRCLSNMGIVLRDLDRFEESVLFFKRALQQDLNNPDLLAEIGLSLSRQGLPAEAIDYYEKSLLCRPDSFAVCNNLGSALREMGRTEEALGSFEKALALAPKRAEVFINLAAIFWDLNELDRALECYDRALALKPDYSEALVNYGLVLWVQGRTEEAREKFETALKNNPADAAAISNLGALRHDQADLDGALTYYEKALRIDRNYPRARFGKALVQLAYGQYNEGWMNYEAGLGLPMLRGMKPFASRMWNGSVKPGARLLIWSEQGLGDALQFIRYAPLARERVGHVTVLCPKPLVSLFRKVPGVDEVCETVKTSAFDEHVAMMSLPYIFGTTLATIPSQVPYLFVDSAITEKWSKVTTPLKGYKIGLVWAGNARETIPNAHMLDQRRSLDLAQLLPLLDLKGTSFVSLQMGRPASQIASLQLQDRLIDPMSGVSDFSDTAAIINGLDLVITVDTSIAHLAGGLGKPVWILSRYDACWRWLRNRPDSPWYPTARLFGQPASGDWTSVIAAVGEALQNLIR